MFFANIKTSKKRQDIFQSQQKKQVRTIFGSAQSINEDTKQIRKSEEIYINSKFYKLRGFN